MGCRYSQPIYCEEFTNEPTTLSISSNRSFTSSNKKEKLYMSDSNISYSNESSPHYQD